MKLKVAILEDNKELLKDLHGNLKASGLVEVVAWATNSDEFLEKVGLNKPEALVLDIDLGGDSMNGIDIAEKLRLPVLFASGKTRDFLSGIEELNINSNIPVEHISKPITLDKLKKILPKFIAEIETIRKSKFIYLDFGDTINNEISVDSIVYLCADKANGAESNNKQIYFNNRKPETLIDFSFTKMEEKGFNKNIFIQIHRSFRVNVDKILNYNRITHEIEVSISNSAGKSERKLLAVSENYRNDVSRIRK